MIELIRMAGGIEFYMDLNTGKRYFLVCPNCGKEYKTIMILCEECGGELSA
jgi:uncharacterized OB-fold protein